MSPAINKLVAKSRIKLIDNKRQRNHICSPSMEEFEAQII